MTRAFRSGRLPATLAVLSIGAGTIAACARLNATAREESAAMHTTSKDGTRIAYWRGGTGPALLLVHGTTADHSRWARLLPELERHFTVYAMDRRGRGGSGDAPEYAIAREFEDVAAVVDAIGGPVFVLGHSYGAICGLEGARLTDGVRKLILYEPPLPIGGVVYPPGAPERIQARVDAGDNEGALETFMREVVRMPESELAAYRQLPAWKVRVTLAPTIARELTIERGYTFDPERFGGFTIETLLLAGGESAPVFREPTDALHAALSRSTLVVLPGQRHVAMDTAPDLFLKEVFRFLGAEHP